MVTCHIAPRVILDFWFEETPEATFMYCKKHSDTRPLDRCTKYVVVSILSTVEVKRHECLPSGWGFELTEKRKIREVP